MPDNPTPTPDQPAPKARWWHNRRKLFAAIAGFFVLLVAVAAAGYTVFKRPPDVNKGDLVPFEKPAEKPKPVIRTTNWPMYGYDIAHTRHLPANKVKPPYKELWNYNDQPLLEFPPIFVDNRLYFLNNDGYAFSLDANTGKKVWTRRIAQLNASSPTYSRGRLYIANLTPGQLVCLDAKSGKTIWKRPLPGRSESSPLVVGKRIYFGNEDGGLYAASTKDGHTIWRAGLAGPVKASPAFDKGTLFVGDYGGEMSAINAKDGSIKWQAGSQGLSFSRTGQFYSTPAVAFGRVYSGNNDGRVYSFNEENGELAWTHSTGGYVYSSPAVASTKGSPPTVYIGSFDGNAYALDAKTGDTRWQREIGGSVIGSLSVIGKVVYVATFEGTTTFGFRIKDGSTAFTYHTGAYSPVISDGRRIYLTGYSSLQALQPYNKRKAQARAKAKARAEAKQNTGQKATTNGG